jgi:hypothetical protein
MTSSFATFRKSGTSQYQYQFARPEDFRSRPQEVRAGMFIDKVGSVSFYHTIHAPVFSRWSVVSA